ncbi:MAG TPA: hypothetical protein VFA61_09115 [Candidatus Udaeobacter sp.]|nr:hypothetical protein [Candidatus Udaeobacter sp.]
MATADCRITVTEGSIGAASSLVVAGIGVVMAGNIFGAIENEGPIGQEFRVPREIGPEILLFARAAAIEGVLADAAIFSRSVNTITQQRPSRPNVRRCRDPQFAFAGLLPAEAVKAGHELISASAESRDVGKLHLVGDDFGFGQVTADAKTAELVSAGLLCDEASNLIHLPAYAIDHRQTIHQLEDAEYYHPTKIEIISEIGDQLCRKLGGHPFARARE